MQVLNQFGAVVERASIDEAYLDLSSIVEKRQERGTRSAQPHSFLNQFFTCLNLGPELEPIPFTM